MVLGPAGQIADAEAVLDRADDVAAGPQPRPQRAQERDALGQAVAPADVLEDADQDDEVVGRRVREVGDVADEHAGVGPVGEPQRRQPRPCRVDLEGVDRPAPLGQ